MTFMDHYGPSRLLLSNFKVLDYNFQESHSSYQKGKMDKIRVLTGNDWTLIVDLIPDLSVGSMISSIRAYHFDLITYFNSSPEISRLIDEIWSIVKKVNYTLKSQTLTFWSNFSFKDHISSIHSKIWNLIIKKSRRSKVILKSQTLQDIEIFLSIFYTC